jgi:hypothetical protein
VLRELSGMQHCVSGRQGEPATVELRSALAAMLRQQGETSLVKELGLSRQTIARIMGGLPVRRGTIALLRVGLAERASSANPTHRP